MDRVAIRISRFEDQDAYHRVLYLLMELYPQRERGEFEQALARLPCLLSHDADLRAAEALQSALEARGASVRVLPAEQARSVVETVDHGTSVRQTMLASPEVDVAFLRRAPNHEDSLLGSARAVSDQHSEQLSGDWSRKKAPWEK